MGSEGCCVKNRKITAATGSEAPGFYTKSLITPIRLRYAPGACCCSLSQSALLHRESCHPHNILARWLAGCDKLCKQASEGDEGWADAERRRPPLFPLPPPNRPIIGQ
ncbi:hypothetical protein DL89DRAFT_27564 [Linderina pennispora]|uniref:Uncharacterized protein n=1 Tax=Linderina pennispora TaxID=61395 RepID=A0A1Y1W3P4_9FUNG|nr:uncharacterized protein DL89DRAFT_27564 [Linderina pennispora]ORX68163.1 hypothetical protein DL89DRAFT_27564 [Linderina pennispora]